MRRLSTITIRKRCTQQSATLTTRPTQFPDNMYTLPNRHCQHSWQHKNATSYTSIISIHSAGVFFRTTTIQRRKNQLNPKNTTIINHSTQTCAVFQTSTTQQKAQPPKSPYDSLDPSIHSLTHFRQHTNLWRTLLNKHLHLKPTKPKSENPRHQ